MKAADAPAEPRELSRPAASVGSECDTGPVTSPVPEAPGEQIGKYQIQGVLGQGGMGAVYRAFDPVLEREVALKVMLPHIAEDPEQKRQFEREAKAVARLTHANVVTVFDLGYHTDGAPYIVMELLRGQDLLHLMESKPPLSLPRKLSIVSQVLEGLGHAHKLGIVHRDIKPANVAITEDGTAKIMDFGIAHLGSVAVTANGPVMGTAAYMSPEQARGEVVDGRSDLFSVGAMLCELITGRRPFQAESIMGSLYKLAHDEPEVVLPPGPEHEGLLPVLRKALAKDRDERYATSAAFARDLASCLDATAPVPTAAERRTPAGERPSSGENREHGPTVTPGGAPRASRPAAPAAAHTPSRPADPSRLFRLLREVYVGGKSGHLHCTAGQSYRSLRIFKGQMVHGTSDVNGEHLGDVLVRYGVIPEAVRVKAVDEVLKERRRLGDVLVSQGLLDEARLAEAVGLHVREILFSMLEGPEGSHSFEELTDSVLDVDVPCPLSMGEVILEATRRVQNPALVRRVLGDTSRVLALSNDPLLRSQRITLTPTDGFILSRVDGTLSAREVLSLSPVASEDAERSLFGLLCTGIVDYREKETTGRTRSKPARHEGRRAEAPSRPPTPQPPVPASAPAAGSTPAPSAPSESHGNGETETSKVEEARQLILEAHERLGGDHFEVLGLSRSATDKDLRQAYGRIARLLHPDVCTHPALADLKEQREKAFIRLTQAYETLRNPRSRRSYEMAFEPSKLRGPATPTPIPGAPPVTEAESPPEPPAPSRAGPGALVKEAEVLFGRGEYWDVIRRLEPVVHQLDGPIGIRAVLVLARAYMKNPNWEKQAEGLLLELVRRQPDCSPALCYLGSLYAGHGLASRARSMYRKVLDLEPEHRVAALALEELDLKEGRAQDGPARGGRLQSWFKGFRPTAETASRPSGER